MNHFKSREQENVLKNCRGKINFFLQVYLSFYCRYYDYRYSSETADLLRFMSEAKNILKNNILEYFEEHGQLKYCWPFLTRWRRKDGTTFSHVFRARTRTFLHPGDFLELWESDHIDIQIQFDEFLNNGYFFSFQYIYLSSSP